MSRGRAATSFFSCRPVDRLIGCRGWVGRGRGMQQGRTGRLSLSNIRRVAAVRGTRVRGHARTAAPYTDTSGQVRQYIRRKFSVLGKFEGVPFGASSRTEPTMASEPPSSPFHSVPPRTASRQDSNPSSHQPQPPSSLLRPPVAPRP
jgi:hypothetical protein